MTRTYMKKLAFGAVALAFSITMLTACGGDEPAGQEAEVNASPQMIQRDAPRKSAETESPATPSNDFRVVPDLAGELENDGYGLETIINASSKNAYAESLRWISQDVSAAQYEQLEQSLRYIKAFDSSVLGSEERFLEAIDGKTGQELIDRASKLIAERRR